MKNTPAEDINPEEAQRRFEKLVRTALNTPPKPMKDLPRKKPKAAVRQTRTTRRET